MSLVLSTSTARVKSLNLDDRLRQERLIPHNKSTIIKNKYALQYLAGQERMCRMSGIAQRITPQLLNLRSRDQDMHRVFKAALQPWPTLVAMKSLIAYTTEYKMGETYFRADWFCKHNHDTLRDRRAIRQRALDGAAGANDGPILPVFECEPFVYKRQSPRTLAQISSALVIGSSSSLSRSSLFNLQSADRGVTSRSRFSLAGSDASYSDTVDGDYSDCGEAYGIYRSSFGEVIYQLAASNDINRSRPHFQSHMREVNNENNVSPAGTEGSRKKLSGY